MKHPKLLLLIAVLATALISCQKEVNLQNQNGGGGQASDITGNYKFVSMTASTKSTITTGSGPLQEKAITVSDYTSTNNIGTVAITSDKFNTTGIGYDVDGIAYGYFYLGGVLIDSLEFPFNVTIPPTSGSSNYRRITNDSIYFDGGFINNDPTGGGTPTQAIPTGARLSWASDTLILRTSFSMATTQDIGGGVMANVLNQGTQVVQLKKQ